jgi:late competence protein required for DNA uptake (superfamily II DNA/RNA helicase)
VGVKVKGEALPESMDLTSVCVCVCVVSPELDVDVVVERCQQLFKFVDVDLMETNTEKGKGRRLVLISEEKALKLASDTGTRR